MIRLLSKFCLPLAGLLLSAACAGTPEQAGPRTRVTVLGVMHAMHEELPGYDFDDLRRIIPALEPDVLVVELQPEDPGPVYTTRDSRVAAPKRSRQGARSVV